MSNFLALSDIVQKVITSLSLYQGTATQKYAEDRIADMIIHLFNRLFDDRNWLYTTKWFKYTLTGQNGVVAEDVSKDFNNYNDICCISTDSNPEKTLKRLHFSTNPYKITGNTPQYMIPSSDSKKIFAIVPFESTGTIYVNAKIKPNEYLPDTIIPFDPDILIYGVSYEYCCDDGNSQLQANKFRELYEARLQQLINIDNEGKLDWNDEEAYFIDNNIWR